MSVPTAPIVAPPAPVLVSPAEPLPEPPLPIGYALVLATAEAKAVTNLGHMLDRSKSWMTTEIWELCAPVVSGWKKGDAAVAKATNRALRSGLAKQVLLAGGAPTGHERFRILIPRTMLADLEKHADRLGLSTWDITGWCWATYRAELAAREATVH